MFNSPNLNLYAYTYQNPVKYIDPDGSHSEKHTEKNNPYKKGSLYYNTWMRGGHPIHDKSLNKGPLHYNNNIKEAGYFLLKITAVMLAIPLAAAAAGDVGAGTLVVGGGRLLLTAVASTKEVALTVGAYLGSMAAVYGPKIARSAVDKVFGKEAYDKILKNNKAQKVFNFVKEFLGLNPTATYNEKTGDISFTSKDGLRKVRFDRAHAQYNRPHMHLEKRTNIRAKFRPLIKGVKHIPFEGDKK
ncbi:MAG: hypothetical protein IEMM0008_0373 [bacterium]|nr:MAG: hypothetical protein IEMM0008_0373 [bacterium]